jgi:hypothetical protein
MHISTTLVAVRGSSNFGARIHMPMVWHISCSSIFGYKVYVLACSPRPGWLPNNAQILYALDGKRHTFLSDPVWLEAPWRNVPKTHFDQIYDFLSQAPELLAQGQIIEQLDVCGKLEHAVAMISRCWKMEHGLEALYESMEKSHAGPLFWPELARDPTLEFDLDDAEDGKLFPVAFYFPNLGIAHFVLVYWAVQCMLWHGLFQLHRLMDQLKTALGTAGRVEELDGQTEAAPLPVEATVKGGLFDLRPLEHRADFAAPARNIFQSVEYCLLEETRDSGPRVVASPLRIAMETLRSYPQFQREVRWADAVMEEVPQRSLRLLNYYTGRD